MFLQGVTVSSLNLIGGTHVANLRISFKKPITELEPIVNRKAKNASIERAPKKEDADKTFALELKGMISPLAKALIDSTIGSSGNGQSQSNETHSKTRASSPAILITSDSQIEKPIDESAVILKELIKHLDL